MTDPYSTHQNMLRKCIEATTGPVLELGIGEGSTPLIHELCAEKGRLVVSFDTDQKYVNEYFHRYNGPNHEFHIIGREDWDKANLEHGNNPDFRWGVVLVDHRPAKRRRIDVERLKDRAELIVCHDTEPTIDRFYRYSRVWGQFQHVYHDHQIPRTSVLSSSASAWAAFEKTMERA